MVSTRLTKRKRGRESSRGGESREAIEMYIYVYTRINTVESAEFPIEIFLALANEGSLAICREFILSSLPRFSLVCRVFEIIPPPRGRSERTDGENANERTDAHFQ